MNKLANSLSRKVHVFLGLYELNRKKMTATDYPQPGKFIDPLKDWGFRHYFDSERNKEILIEFLNDLLKAKNILKRWNEALPSIAEIVRKISGFINLPLLSAY